MPASSGHVKSKTGHGVAELRHGVDSNIEKLANQRCISTHNDFIRRVTDGKRFKVGAWIYRQLASISIFMPYLTNTRLEVQAKPKFWKCGLSRLNPNVEKKMRDGDFGANLARWEKSSWASLTRILGRKTSWAGSTRTFEKNWAQQPRIFRKKYMVEPAQPIFVSKIIC